MVARARAKCRNPCPAMTGDPVLEWTIRARYNTLEWLLIFLASLWFFAIYWNDLFAAEIGVVWIVGRVLYQRGYAAEANKRGLGFMISLLAAPILVFGAPGRIVYLLATVRA